MTRVLFWLALALLVGFAVRSKLRALELKRQQGERGSAALDDAEPMANCAHCHMYFPASEAVRVGGHDFCSSAHARLSVD